MEIYITDNYRYMLPKIIFILASWILLSFANVTSASESSASKHFDSPDHRFTLKTQLIGNYGFASDPTGRSAVIILLHQDNILWIGSTDLGMYDFGPWYASAIWNQNSSEVLVIQRINRSQVIADLISILPTMQGNLIGDLSASPTLEIKRLFDSEKIVDKLPLNGPSTLIVYFEKPINTSNGMQFTLVVSQEKVKKIAIKINSITKQVAY